MRTERGKSIVQKGVMERMGLVEYRNALRLGKKEYQYALAKEKSPCLPVLDEILKDTKIDREVNLGLINIPLAHVVGTKTTGRTPAFANNFMPLLDENSEFCMKWSNVYDYQIEKGIDDPIIVYEYMNQFYVQEGNKRVSVLKYLKAYSIAAYVTRLVPKKDESPKVRLYYEFLDFYEATANYNIKFEKEGSYDRLMKAMNISPDTPLDRDGQKEFRQTYEIFEQVFDKFYFDDVHLSIADAFLKYVELFGYAVVKTRNESHMRTDFKKLKNELLLSAKGNRIELVTQPKEEVHTGEKLLNWLWPAMKIEPEMLKIAFIYPKTCETSRWTYGHELGRVYLEDCFQGKLKTVVYDHADSDEEVCSRIKQAIADRCNVIFAAGPQMAVQCVKTAVQHPEVRIFNCSINMSYSSICNYYPCTFEAKFLMGALAAAMSETDKIGYIADYPIYGMVANINAFALGASMINPRIKVYLKWSGQTEHPESIEWEEDIQIISGVDMIVPEKASREYGLYYRYTDGRIENLAMAFCNWGKFYEKMVKQICSGSSETRNVKKEKASNYWWGMSAEVIDIIYSDNLPNASHRLIDFLSSSICNGTFHPFAGRLYAQNNELISEDIYDLPLMEVIQMNWLLNNIVGEIPPMEEFRKDAQSLVRLQGVKSSSKMNSKHMDNNMSKMCS